jgi:2-oxoglutarate ferredoxin oxidoreductase subunit alpha
MVEKQVEDEITAIGSTLGAMFAGTRALTATSGGGFDLMTEHISLSGITEVPLVVVIGQRPGPATGLPTWTTQADLMLALHAGHGEFPRIVIAPSDPEDIYYKLQEAFNISEKYQVPVIFLTDKLLAESLYLTNSFDENKVSIERYLVTEDRENLHRYEDTSNGVSPRWNPGTLKTTYVINSDEHDIDGNVIEDSEGAIKMQEKRHRKVEYILKDIPEPEVIKKNEAGEETKYKIGLIGWGSTKGVMKDVVDSMEGVAALSYTYVFPLKVDTLKSFIDKCERVVMIEGNFNSQLGDLIKLETGIDIKDKILKYDGRPFFLDEVIKKLND